LRKSKKVRERQRRKERGRERENDRMRKRKENMCVVKSECELNETKKQRTTETEERNILLRADRQ
jgi:hypothetical protein